MKDNSIKKKKVIWSEAAEDDLIELWREKISQLRSAS